MSSSSSTWRTVIAISTPPSRITTVGLTTPSDTAWRVSEPAAKNTANINKVPAIGDVRCGLSGRASSTDGDQRTAMASTV